MPYKNIPNTITSEARDYLREQEGLDWLDFIQKIPCNFFIKDSKGAYVVLHFSELLVGTTPDERKKLAQAYLGKTDAECSWKEYTEAVRKNDLEVMETKKTKTFIEEVKFPSGETMKVVSIKSPARNQAGEVIGILGLAIKLP